MQTPKSWKLGNGTVGPELDLPTLLFCYTPLPRTRGKITKALRSLPTLIVCSFPNTPPPPHPHTQQIHATPLKKGWPEHRKSSFPALTRELGRFLLCKLVWDCKVGRFPKLEDFLSMCFGCWKLKCASSNCPAFTESLPSTRCQYARLNPMSHGEHTQ